MGYRDAEPNEIARPRGDVLLRVDATGAGGADGARGNDGAGGMSAGANGHPGGHAGPARAGEPGGVVDVALVELAIGRCRVEGTRSRQGGSAERVERDVEIGDHGAIDVVARGGKGGDGGRGGDGGDGARGHRGQDATRYSRGTDGGRGGDGGHGGAGSSGAPGGDGGGVRVRVRDEDTHLLMLVRSGVEGGAGGRPGLHGRGGRGGSGGEGGSSHSWTTHHTERDAQGHTHHRTKHHSNPGGSDGRSGGSGASGSGPLYEGAVGRDGTFVIEVAGSETRRYESRYHLVLRGATIVTPDADGITEPGERVELRDVRLTNVGGMPTPRTREVRLEVRESEWVRPILGEKLIVPPSLPAGATAVLKGPLAFELREHVPLCGSDPLSVAEPVLVEGVVPDVARSFASFVPPDVEAARTLTVRFPAALSVVEALPSLAAGEVSRFRFAVLDQSTKALGAASEGGRVLSVHLALERSELADESAVVIDDRGERIPLGQPYVRTIDRLEPGQTWLFEGAIGFLRGTPGYRALRLRLTLELGRPGEPRALRAVQMRDLEVRVAERLGDERFDWLLVTHQHTTREEVDAWRALAERSGHVLGIYDLALHGHLSLEAPHEGGESLLARADGGLLIVPDHPFDTPRGPRRPSTFLTPPLLRAMAQHRVDLLLVGGDGELTTMLQPADAGEPSALDGTDALIARLSREREAGAPIAERIPVHEVVFGLERPSEVRLERRAATLARRLATLFPTRVFEVVWELDPDLSPSWAPIRRRRLGYLRVLSRASGLAGAAHLARSDEAASDPARIDAEDTRMASLLARGAGDRLASLVRELETTAPRVPQVEALADAILLAIAVEHLSTLRIGRARAGLGKAELRTTMRTLSALEGTRLLGAHEVGSPAFAALARLAARLRVFARLEARWWERVPGLSWLRRAGMLVGVVDGAVAAFVRAQSDDPRTQRALAEAVEAAEDALWVEWKTARRSGASRELFGRQLCLTPAWHPELTLDEELVLAHQPVATALSDWETAEASAERAAQHSAQTAEGLDEQRARLLLQTTAEALLPSAAAIEEEDAEHRVRAARAR